MQSSEQAKVSVLKKAEECKAQLEAQLKHQRLAAQQVGKSERFHLALWGSSSLHQTGVRERRAFYMGVGASFQQAFYLYRSCFWKQGCFLISKNYLCSWVGCCSFFFIH